MDMPDMTGRIFNIQRYSTEDGPGIRTTVFMKGCPLSCPWCHNPESIRSEPELVWHPVRCIGDGACVTKCPQGALARNSDGALEIDRAKCTACGQCVSECPSGAIEMFGRDMTVSEMMAIVAADKNYYETSGGGVTFSGGEPFRQKEFLIESLKTAKEMGIHTAVDTTAYTTRDAVEAVARFADMFLIDLKIMDAAAHKRVTGVNLDRIMQNAEFISKELGKPVWVRFPLIAGYTDEHPNIRAAAEFAAKSIPTLERFDMLAFSNLCSSKYSSLGREWLLKDIPLFDRVQAQACADVACGVLSRDIVKLSGPMKVD